MKFRLQLFGFDQSAYERPNQKWVCGWASEGTPCHRGPDSHGRCCGGFACKPIQSDSRWVCTRSAAAGGPCPQGPLPDGSCCQSIVNCQPVRSLRAKRAVVVAWTFALTTGILLVGLSHWDRFVSPGPVSSGHAPLIATGAGCAMCHTAPHNWMTALDRDSAADSRLCLRCHRSEAQFHHDDAMLPHGLPASLLNSPTRRQPAPAAAATLSLATFAPSGPTGEIACGTCHHEHRGADGKLAVMDNRTCQACHAVKFRSFKEGHPEFHQHPEAAVHTVMFSHATHRDQHFGNEKFECASCHAPSQDGRIKTAAFESSCARCHSDHLNGKAEPSKSGVVFLQIPAFDLQTLTALRVDVGQWPRYDGDPPVHLTPFMRVLLGGDHSDYLAHLPSDLGQLADASDDQIIAVQQLAWAIKALLNNGQKSVTSLRPAISTGLARTVSDEQFVQLTAGLSSDDIKSAADRWFPQLSSEMQKPFEKWNPGNRPKKASEPAPAPAKAPETKPPAPGSDDLFNGDAPPALKPAAPPAPAAKPPAAAASAASDDLFNGDAPSAAPAPKPAAAPTPKPPAAAASATGDDLFNSDAPPPTSKPVGPAAAPTAPEAKESPAPAPSAPVLSPNGWQRDDEKFALIYYPTGHANLFMRRWLEASTAQGDKPANGQLLSAEVAGACTKCHAPIQSGTAFAWSLDSMGPRRDFVKFSHSPHLLELRLQNCVVCHASPQPSDAPASVDSISGFKFIQKQSCTACHAPQLASDSCLTCHNYHVMPRAADAVVLEASPASVAARPQ